MRNQSWGNAARQDFIRRGGSSPSFHVVEKRVSYDDAGFWLRLFAWWWDSLIFTVMQITLILPLVFTFMITTAVSLEKLRTTFGTPQGLRTLMAGGSFSPALIAIGVVTVGVYCLYHVSFEVFFKGATPGKWLIGLRVFDADDKPVTIGQSLARNIYKFAAFGIVIFGLILSSGLIQSKLVIFVPVVLVVTSASALLVGMGGYLMAGFTFHKQALHDKWSDSYVVIDPACSNVKRITFSVIAAVMIILSSIYQYNEHRSRLEQPDQGQSISYRMILQGKTL